MTPPPPGQQATAERHAALTPLLERVFPRHQSCDDDGAVWVTTGLTPDMRRLAPNHHEVTGTCCACDKPTAPTAPAVVLDPFGGTGTVALVARALGRYGVSCDLSGDYQRLAKWRIWQSGQAARVAAKTDGERQGDLFGATA